MKKTLSVILLAFLSCARHQPPPRWTAPESLISATLKAREAAARAYYIARTESPAEAWNVLKSGAEEVLAAVEAARSDTLALVPKERAAYGRALYFLKGYGRLLLDTSLVYKSVRFTGQAPSDPGLEEACAILCVLAFQHGRLEALEKVFGREFTQNERLEMKSSYGSIVMGGPGPDLGLWPAPEPGRPGTGPVMEAWAEDETTATAFPILNLAEGGFSQPPAAIAGGFYLYGPGGEVGGRLAGEIIRATEGRFRPGAYYLALPSPVLWWDTTSPPQPNADSLLSACKAYLSSVGAKPDSVILNQVVPFWVWQGRPGFIAFGNALRGRKANVFYAVLEEGKVLYGETIPSEGEFYGVEFAGAIDLDYDRISEIVLSAEGEDSSFYIVLKKANGLWWKVYRTEPVTEF